MKVLCSTRDVPAGGCHRIELTDRPPLAVFNLDGRFYVTDDTCTHGDASLCDGEIDCDDQAHPFFNHRHSGYCQCACGGVVAI